MQQVVNSLKVKPSYFFIVFVLTFKPDITFSDNIVDEAIKQEKISVNDSVYLESINNQINTWLNNPRLTWAKRENKMDSIGKIYLREFGNYSLSYGLITHKKGVFKYYQGVEGDMEAFREAIQFYKKAIDYRTIIKEYSGFDLLPDIIKGYGNIGGCFLELSEPYLALDYLKKGLALGDFYPNPEKMIDIILNLNLYTAQTYDDIGDYDNAIKYYNKIINYGYSLDNKEVLNKIKSKKILALNDCGGLYGNLLYDPETALKYLEKSKKMIEARETLPNNLNTAINHRYLGVALYRLEKYDSARYYIKKSLDISIKLDQRELIAQNYTTLATCYNKLNNLDSAQICLEKASKIFQKTGNKEDLWVLFDNQADRSFLIGSYKESIKFHNQAISHLIDRFHPISIFSNPKINDKIVINKRGLVFSLNSKANRLLFVFRQNNDPSYLHAAYQTFQLADQVIGLWRQEFQAEASRMSLAKYAKPIYEGAIEACYELYQLNHQDSLLNKAFEYSEKSRAIVLLDAVRRTKANAKVNPKLISSERALNLKVNYFEKQAAIFEQDDSKKPSYNVYDSILYYRRHRQSIIDKIKETTPEYYSLIFDQATTSPKSLRNKLHEDQSFIEYFVGDSSLYTFLVDKDTILLLKNDEPDTVKSLVADWVDKVPELNLSFMEPAYRIYNDLIEPISEHAILKSNLTIAPDDVLNMLNFEALVTELPESKRVYLPAFKDYLIYDNQIDYAFSASTLLETSHGHKKRTTNYLGIAPEINDGFNLEDNWFDKLEYNEEEVEQAGSLFRQKKIIENPSAKSSFLEQAPTYNLIHCATHALANNQNGDLSCIIFGRNESDVLYAKDLYALDLNADLVVLSACQTNAGELTRGEGIISLARSFVYAGAASVITSLWNVREKTNKEIFYNFYQALEDGKTKNEALRLAKLNYLSNITRENQAQAHPYFWAPLVIIGDTSPLPKDRNSEWKILLGALFVISIFFVWIMKKQKTKKYSDPV